jgi:hypothetical protein
VVGGDHASVLEFVADMVREIFARGTDSVDSDTAAFNYIVHSDKVRARYGIEPHPRRTSLTVQPPSS